MPVVSFAEKCEDAKRTDIFYLATIFRALTPYSYPLVETLSRYTAWPTLIVAELVSDAAMSRIPAESSRGAEMRGARRGRLALRLFDLLASPVQTRAETLTRAPFLAHAQRRPRVHVSASYRPHVDYIELARFRYLLYMQTP